MVAVTTAPASPVVTPTVALTPEIDLSWLAIPTALTYKIERSTDQGVTWGTLVASQAGLTYADKTVVPDAAYKYRVTALDGSEQSVATVTSVITTYLPAPATLTATNASAAEVDLTWPSVKDVASYKIERSTNAGTAWTTLVAAQAGSSTSYADTTVSAGSSYMYRISAINAGGFASNTTSSSSILTIPAQPTLTDTVTSSTSVALSWVAVTGGSNYKVETSTDGGNTWAAAPLQTTLTYTATTIPNLAYKFRLTAIDTGGNSVPSPVITVNTTLPAPTLFTAVGSATSNTEIDLTWHAVTNATSYKIERSIDNTVWTTLVPAPALTGTNGGLCRYQRFARYNVLLSYHRDRRDELFRAQHGRNRAFHARHAGSDRQCDIRNPDQPVLVDLHKRDKLQVGNFHQRRHYVDHSRHAEHSDVLQHRADRDFFLQVSRFGNQRHRDVGAKHCHYRQPRRAFGSPGVWGHRYVNHRDNGVLAGDCRLGFLQDFP